MATKAKRADIIQIAFPAALGHWKNVIGIPKTLTHPFAQSPVQHKVRTAVAARSFQLAMFLDRIQATVGAHAPVALQYLFA